MPEQRVLFAIIYMRLIVLASKTSLLNFFSRIRAFHTFVIFMLLKAWSVVKYEFLVRTLYLFANN